jgi:hypothetical protein
MASDLLSNICREIDERLEELRPLLGEYEQLLLAAENITLEPEEPRPAAVNGGLKRATSRGRSGSAGGRERAVGEAILAALDHGSHTVAELAVVTALSASSINAGLRRLSSVGLTTKIEREGKIAWELPAA